MTVFQSKGEGDAVRPEIKKSRQDKKCRKYSDNIVQPPGNGTLPSGFQVRSLPLAHQTSEVSGKP